MESQIGYWDHLFIFNPHSAKGGERKHTSAVHIRGIQIESEYKKECLATPTLAIQCF